MQELSLNEMKKIEFNILKMFDSFCKDNNIRYFLTYGTLLGAIRYKGFIPWDDDLDVLVPREDYDRLIKIFQDTEQYHLFAFEKDNNFLFPFAKICDMTTKKVEPGHNHNSALGLDIDVFPLDAWDSDLSKAKKEVKQIRRNSLFLNLIKLEKPVTKNIFKRVVFIVAAFFCRLFGSGFFINNIIKESKKTSVSGARYLGCKTWCVYGEKGIIPAEAYSDAVEVEFEGERFPAPIGYDLVLTCLYGDYLPEPPVEKRKTHHSFKAYRL